MFTMADGEEEPVQDPADDENEEDDTAKPADAGFTVTFSASVCGVLPSPTTPSINCWSGMALPALDFDVTISASDAAEVVLNPSLNSASDAEDRTFADVPIGTSFLIGAANPSAITGMSVSCIQTDTGAAVDVDPSTIAPGESFELNVTEPSEIKCLVSLVILGDPDAGGETDPADEEESDDPAEGGEEPVGSILVFIKGCAEGVALPESPLLQNAIDVCTEDAPSTTVDIYNSDGELMYGGYSGDYGLNSVPNEIVFVGTYTLDVVPPDRYALALPYCWQEEVDDDTANGTNGPEAATNPNVLNTGSNDVIEVTEYMKTTCYVYLVPTEGGEDVSVEPGEPNAEEPAAGESGAIEVSLFGCEAGFIPTDMDSSKLLYNNCPDIVPEMAVDIYDSTGTIAYSGYGSSPVTFRVQRILRTLLSRRGISEQYLHA